MMPPRMPQKMIGGHAQGNERARGRPAELSPGSAENAAWFSVAHGQPVDVHHQGEPRMIAGMNPAGGQRRRRQPRRWSR